MRVFLVLNRGSGTKRSLSPTDRDRVLARLREHGLEVQLVTTEPPRLRAAVHAGLASGADVIAVGGGDGSVSAAASVMVGEARPLAVLPLGTRNHFARDVGVPLELDEAVACIAAGSVRRVDAAELNGRVFVNNSSLGLYPEIVLRRELERAAQGRGRWSSFARASLSAMRSMPVLRVHVRTSEGELLRRTGCVLVANNRYELGAPWAIGRPRLDAGMLALYVAGALSRGDVLRLAGRALVGRLYAAPNLDVVEAASVEVSTDRARVRVSLDGEVHRLSPPLVYRTLPGALRVVARPGVELAAAPAYASRPLEGA